MGQEQDARTDLAAGLSEEAVTSQTGRLLGARRALPAQDFGARAQRPCGPGRRFGLGRAVAPQAMVDDEGVQRAAVLARQIGQQMQQRGGVAAARQAERQRAGRTERAAVIEKGGDVQAQQPARAASRRALRRASSSAAGNSASKLFSTPHASATWSIAASEAARRTSASGARGPERSARSDAR